MTTIVRKTALLALPLAVALSVSACGEGKEKGSGRPTTDQILTAFKSGPLAGEMPSGVPDTALQCIAQKFEDSGISDAGLRALVNGDDNYKESKSDDDAVASLQSDMASCAK